MFKLCLDLKKKQLQNLAIIYSGYHLRGLLGNIIKNSPGKTLKIFLKDKKKPDKIYYIIKW